MKPYRIKSPSGVTLTIQAESIYHAINLAHGQEGYVYEVKKYYEINNIRK